MFRALLVLLCIAVTSPTLADEPVFGTYSGILRHESLKRDQRAVLDLIFDRQVGNDLEISAVLKLSFGEATRGEYVSYVFDKVRFNLLTGALAFDQADQGLTIVVSKFKNGQMEGTVRAPLLGGAPVTIELSKKDDVKAKFPLLKELSGIYKSKTGTLQLQAYRSPQEKADGGASPFGENEIRAHLGRVNENLGGLIVDSIFNEASYDFFKGTLSLFGNLDPLDCTVDIEGIVCDGETFKREKTDDGERILQKPAFWDQELDTPGNPAVAPASLSGQYWGYIHLELRNQYQITGLNIVAVPGEGEGGFQISAVASVHFGDNKSPEAIPFKYEPRNFPLFSNQFVLKRDENDAIIQINSWKDGVLKGQWYSRCFGRVGTFELKKDMLRALPQEARLLPSLGGIRNSDFWQIRLNVAARPIVIHSANPFSPLSFGGYFWDSQRVVIPKSYIRGGSYDYYTGRLFLPVFIAGEELYLWGQHLQDGNLALNFHLSNQFGARFAPQTIGFQSLKSGGNR